MISNQVLQSTLEGIKKISRMEMALVDTEGIVLTSTMGETDDFRDSVLSFEHSPAESQVISKYHFFKIQDDGHLEYVLIVQNSSENVYVTGKMAAYQIQCLLVAYKERFDKDNFVKNLLLDNLLLVDIYNRAKKLHIDVEARRIVYILEMEGARDGSHAEAVRELLTSRPEDFITEIDEKSIIVVKRLGETDGQKELNQYGQDLLDLLPGDRKTDAVLAYGTVVGELKDVSRSYKEARMALNVGKIFFTDRQVIAYSQLGIGRLIYQLPIPLCKMFIREVFDGKSPDEFDEETLSTINKFFENSLNVSETSRQLYIHRNTLVYRLDKLQKQTGLDLRIFDDAITLKIALMVVRYMKHMEKSPDY